MITRQNAIKLRALEIARYIIDENATVRMAAKKFGVSKSTVHKDIKDRLWDYSVPLAVQANKVLAKNKAERNIRGGLATRKKYLRLKNL